ncbi:MAG: trigger factor [Proteobacteria bacterium]|nr:trigger factor [Pseudomonadota bacterium]
MQVSVESSSGLERRLKVAVEEERIANAVESRLKDMSRTVKLKGFRAGKVPLKVVAKHYGQQVRQEIVGDILQSSFYDAVIQEKLRPAGTPAFDNLTTEPGKGLEYTATFEVYPEVAIADFNKEKIEKPVCNIGDNDVEAMIENIRKQNIAWEVVDRAAENDDRVDVDFKGTIDGDVFEGGEGKGMKVVLGQGRMIDGFEAGLLGAKAGDDLTLELTFPENYQVENLAGKPVSFAIHVNQVAAPKLPEVDAEFATKLGVADGNLDTMREDISANMQRELENKIKSRLKEGIMDKLLAIHAVEVPTALIDNESKSLMNQMMQNLTSQGMAQKDLKLDPAMFRGEAERRVKLGLIMGEIIRQHELTAEPEMVRAMVEKIAAPYEHPEEVVKWYYSDKNHLTEIESLVLEEQIVDWVMEQAEVEEKSYSFNELMNPDAAA